MFSSHQIPKSILDAASTILQEQRDYVVIHKPTGKIKFVGRNSQEADSYIMKHGSADYESAQAPSGQKSVGTVWDNK